MLGISALGSGLISLVIPAVAKINPGNAWPVFAARLLEGAFQGCSDRRFYSEFHDSVYSLFLKS